MPCEYQHNFVFSIPGKDILKFYELLLKTEELSRKSGYKNDFRKLQPLIRQMLGEMQEEAIEKGFNLNEMLNQLNQE